MVYRPPHDEPGAGEDDRRTPYDPVVGWLVCIKGKEKGKDYRIRYGQNEIGRADERHIVVRGDDTISREPHAWINYDHRTNQFTLGRGGGVNNTYLNGENLLQPMRLKAWDRIELSDETMLLFLPLCGEQFRWETAPRPDAPPPDPPRPEPPQPERPQDPDPKTWRYDKR